MYVHCQALEREITGISRLASPFDLRQPSGGKDLLHMTIGAMERHMSFEEEEQAQTARPNVDALVPVAPEQELGGREGVRASARKHGATLGPSPDDLRTIEVRDLQPDARLRLITAGNEAILRLHIPVNDSTLVKITHGLEQLLEQPGSHMLLQRPLLVDVGL